MIAATDVQYNDHDKTGTAACVRFHHWSDPTPAAEHTTVVANVAPYVPGAFYQRELPCLLAVLEPVLPTLTLIVVDGYVWLGDEAHPGLGARLWSALGERLPVVGVAKTRFAGAAPVVEVRRGSSESPLYVSAAGLPLDEAAEAVRQMHGPNRLPTLLKRVDTLCRRG